MWNKVEHVSENSYSLAKETEKDLSFLSIGIFKCKHLNNDVKKLNVNGTFYNIHENTHTIKYAYINIQCTYIMSLSNTSM